MNPARWAVWREVEGTVKARQYEGRLSNMEGGGGNKVGRWWLWWEAEAISSVREHHIWHSIVGHLARVCSQ